LSTLLQNLPPFTTQNLNVDGFEVTCCYSIKALELVVSFTDKHSFPRIVDFLKINFATDKI
jgi:hypothetical protein